MNKTRRRSHGGNSHNKTQRINKEAAAAKKAAKEAEKAAKLAAKEAEKAAKEKAKVEKQKALKKAREERFINKLVAMEMKQAKKEEDRENRILKGLPVRKKRANEKDTYDKLVELEFQNASS